MGAIREQLERAFQIYNRGDLDGYCAFYADDAVRTSPGERSEGRRAIAESLGRQYRACPDAQVRLLAVVEEGDAGGVEWVWTGTHTGTAELPDGTQLPPTGNRVTVAGVSMITLHDGRTTAEHAYWDTMPVLVQLGVVAPPT